VSVLKPILNHIFTHLAQIFNTIFVRFPCSYHQKYRLQQHRDLTSLLQLNSLEDLVNSHIAARLNGYIVGRGGVKQFDEEAPRLGINEDLAKEIRKYVVKFEGQGLFC